MTSSGQKLIITSFAVAFAAIVIAMPQPVEPGPVLPLPLDPDAVHASLEADEALAARASSSAEAARLRELELELGRAERGRQSARERDERLEALRGARAALLEAEGEEAVAAERARASLRVDAFRRGELDPEAAAEALGSFAAPAEIYALVQDGQAVAPPIVFRSIFKARWNAMLGLDAVDGLSPIELQALWGWPALEAVHLPAPQRLAALEHFQAAGGTISLEARATQAYHAGEHEVATRLFLEAHEATGNLRLRNHALWTQAMGLAR